MSRHDRIDPETADLSEIRAMPHFADAVFLSLQFYGFGTNGFDQCGRAWERAVNALLRTVPL